MKRDLDNISNSTIYEEIAAAACEVYNHLGKGCTEHNYGLAFRIEAVLRNFIVELETPLPVLYKGQSAGCVRADLILRKAQYRIVVELKAVATLTATHINQTKNYVQLIGEQQGVLINFSQKPGAAAPEVQVLSL